MANNTLQDVVSYNKAGLALLQNSYCFLNNANKKFKDFQKSAPGNLGTTVSFDLPPRFTTVNSLVISTESAEQRVHNLTVNQQASTSYDFTAQEFIYNVEQYMDIFGRSAVSEIGAKVEAQVAGLARTNTYRFFGDGVTPISSYLQLANALAYFRNYGSAKTKTKGFLSDLTFPAIVNSGLNQFVPSKNEREMMSWEVGGFSNCEWYQSNLLATHTAGNIGQNATTLTVASFTPNADGSVDTITFSGAGTDVDAIKEHDKFQFNDGVAGQTNMRYLTFIGHEVSQCPVQCRVTADAASSGGNVTITFDPPLQSNAGKDKNINTPVAVGMQISVLPSHRCGLIYSGDPLFLAMPRLPEEVPYPTSSEVDPDSGAALRQYYGSLFGQNQRAMVHDCIWGSTLVDEYAMMVALPV